MTDDILNPPAAAMTDAALRRRRSHLLAELERDPRPVRRAAAMVFAAAALAVLTLAPIGGASLASRAATGLSSLWSEPAPPPKDPASAANLGEAASRWTRDSNDPTRAPGVPLLGKARDLLQGLGSASDTITAFPTANGAVCYEIRAAGSCGRLDQWPWSAVGFTFSILYTRDGGTRVFGVAGDQVQTVEVEVADTYHAAEVRNNAFYYQLADGLSGNDVQRLVATWTDGSTHEFHVHDGRSGPG